MEYLERVPLVTSDGKNIGEICRVIVMAIGSAPKDIADSLARAKEGPELLRQLIHFQDTASDAEMLRLHPILKGEIEAVSTEEVETPETLAFEQLRMSSDEESN